jgi:reverse transcriptase-like protein
MNCNSRRMTESATDTDGVNTPSARVTMARESRVFIPKPDGRQRPLGVTAFEDKVVQRALVEVLNHIYEADFLGFSYGYRPGRNPHSALDALDVGIGRTKVNWVLDADIRGYFDSIDHGRLVKFVEGPTRVVSGATQVPGSYPHTGSAGPIGRSVRPTGIISAPCCRRSARAADGISDPLEVWG